MEWLLIKLIEFSSVIGLRLGNKLLAIPLCQELSNVWLPGIKANQFVRLRFQLLLPTFDLQIEGSPGFPCYFLAFTAAVPRT